MKHTALYLEALIHHLTPPLLRKTLRLAWLQALLYPIKPLYHRFQDYRTQAEYEANMTGQTLLLQQHLNKYFDPKQRRILLKHAREHARFVPLSKEGYTPVPFSLIIEKQPVPLALTLDSGALLDADFFVFIPDSLNEIAIATVINTYKIAGKTFKIINTENT